MCNKRNVFAVILLAAMCVVSLTAAGRAEAKTKKTWKESKVVDYNFTDGRYVPSSVVENSYNSDGQLQKKIETTYDNGEKSEVLTSRYKYRNGRLSWVTTKYNSGQIDREWYKYKSGRLARLIKYMNGEVLSDTRYYYDKKGLLKREKSTSDSFAFLSTETFYIYNSRSQLVSKTIYQDGIEEPTSRYTYTYKNGKLTREKIVFRQDDIGISGEYIIKYNAKGYTKSEKRTITLEGETVSGTLRHHYSWYKEKYPKVDTIKLDGEKCEKIKYEYVYVKK